MAQEVLAAQKAHLANLLEAIQRCVYFLNAAVESISWPLTGENLSEHKKETDFF
jgi:hypothetical protein